MSSSIKIFILFLFFALHSCSYYGERQAYADMLIEKIEKFRKQNKRLPKNVSELGLIEEMDSPAFYQLENDTNYYVWYGLSVGESIVYRSSTKEWTRE